MSKAEKHIPSTREQGFLGTVTNGKYDRQIITGIKKFLEGNAPQDMQDFYSAEELKAISDLDGTERDVQARMPIKITRHYFELAVNSPAKGQPERDL